MLAALYLNMKILFVENHEAFSKAVTKEFLHEHEVIVVVSNKEAISVFRSDIFDLVLSDYDLDDGKGDQVVSEIREVNSNIPIIAVSSHDEGNNAMLAAGANAICGKMKFRNINQVIEEILK